jgi:hypothetical protein
VTPDEVPADLVVTAFTGVYGRPPRGDGAPRPPDPDSAVCEFIRKQLAAVLPTLQERAERAEANLERVRTAHKVTCLHANGLRLAEGCRTCEVLDEVTGRFPATPTDGRSPAGGERQDAAGQSEGGNPRTSARSAGETT